MAKVLFVIFAVLVAVSLSIPAKNQWPEVFGMTGEDAKALILSEFPHLQIYILRDGSPVTLDYRYNRVRIFVDEQGVVVRVPHIA